MCRSTPAIDFSTYFGGSGGEGVRDVATDRFGNIYVTGGTDSIDFPATTRILSGGTTESGVINTDIFVVKLTPLGTLVWATRIGGPNYDRTYGIEVDPQGFVILAGRAGRGFPVTSGAFQTTFKGGIAASFYGHQDGFVLKLAPDGQTIVWASYFGTEDSRIVRDLAVDQNGDIFLASKYLSGSYVPAVAGAFRNKPLGGGDGVLAKVAADGSRILWAWYIGGSGEEPGGPSVRVDSSGNAYYLQQTRSSDAITTPTAYRTRLAGGADFHLSKWSATGSILFATYFGGSSNEIDENHNLALDSNGNAYIGAATMSQDLPTSMSAYSRSHNGNGNADTGPGVNYPGDGFIAKISANGTRLLASTFFGGRSGDAIEGIAVDSKGYVHVTGGTLSDNFPVSQNSYQQSFKGVVNAFYAEFSSDLSTLRYSSYLGGGQDAGRTMIVDGAGAAYFGGESGGGFPIRNAVQSSFAGDIDGFLMKMSPNMGLESPCFPPGSVVNSASYLGGIVPGSLISIFGSGLLRGLTGTISGGGAASIQGTSVWIGGLQAPILSVTNTGGYEQINVQAPFEIAGRSSVNMEIESNGTRIPVTDIPVLAAQPGIFEWTAPDGGGNGAVVHTDGSLVSSSNPAQRNEIVSVFFTGGGPLTPAVATGLLGPQSPATMSLPVVVEIDGRICDILFAGYAPNFMGLYQVNFRVRQDAPSGSYAVLRIRIGNAVSPSTLIAL